MKVVIERNLLNHLAVCKTKLDLAILIDAYQKPRPHTDLNFRRYIQFTKRLISGFNIGQYGTHVGIAAFYQDSKAFFGFQSDLWKLLKAINGILFSQQQQQQHLLFTHGRY